MHFLKVSSPDNFSGVSDYIIKIHKNLSIYLSITIDTYAYNKMKINR